MNQPYDKSLGDDQTRIGSHRTPSVSDDPQSLGDQSTHVSGISSDVNDLTDNLEITDLAARYSIVRTLGRGGMGEVLLATDNRLKRNVAIKRIRSEHAHSRSAVQRFLTEAQAIAALNHPNIVHVFDYGRDSDGPFLIMEYVDGQSLLQRCQEGPLSWETAVDLTCGLLDGLASAHELGIIHRDIKPANVLLTKDGYPKLTDFGLAKHETAVQGHTITGAVLGTIDFMAPEQRKDAALTDSRSDLWSLAATLYQMVTGESPRVIDLDLCPKELRSILAKGLKSKKDDRYQSAREFRDALAKSNTLQDSQILNQLAAGDCPSCGTKNDATRKFCRQCAKSLEVQCLTCQTKMPIWEKVCGECGAMQTDRLEARRRAMENEKEQAISALDKLDFGQAMAIVQRLSKESDPRLQQLRGWCDRFSEEIETRRNREHAQIRQRLEEAASHEKAYDYSAAIRTLEQIPHILKSTLEVDGETTVASEIRRLQAIEEKRINLTKEIRERVAKRDLNDLMHRVDALLQITPNRPDVQKLKGQLQEREANLNAAREDAFEKAKVKWKEQDYEGVLSELATIDPAVMKPEIAEMRKQAEGNLQLLRSLFRSIDDAVLNKRLDGLRAEVDLFLTLKPDHQAMLQLRSKLLEREENEATQARQSLATAVKLYRTAHFQQAERELARIREGFQTTESDDLMRNCQSMAILRSEAMAELSSVSPLSNLFPTFPGVEDYRGKLIEESIEDSDFVSRLEAFELGRAQRRAALQADLRRRKLLRYIAVAGALLIALACVGGMAAWITSATRAKVLQHLIERRQWDQALAIDPDNVNALLGRAETRLSEEALNIAGAFEDLLRVEELDPSIQQLRTAQAKAYTVRAGWRIEQGQVLEAENDYAEALKVGASSQSMQELRKKLAQGLIKKALATSPSGDTNSREAFLSKAMKLDPSMEISAAVVDLVANVSVKAFEQSRTDDDLDRAKSAIEKLRVSAPQSPSLVNYTKRLAETLVSRSQKVAATEPEAAWSDLKLAEDLGGEGDNTASLRRDIALAFGEEVVADFESSLTKASQDKAIAQIERIQEIDRSVSESFTKRIGVAVARRGVSEVGSDLDSALVDFQLATTLAEKSPDVDKLKTKVAIRLLERTKVSLASNLLKEAFEDFLLLMDIDGKAASEVEVDVMNRLTPEMIASITPERLGKLSVESLAKLSPDMMTKFPAITNSIGMKLRPVLPGSFRMGEGKETRLVTLTKPFFLGIYEVTDEEFYKVLGNTPSGDADSKKPVSQISWEDANDFCKKLSMRAEERAAGRVYRLPTDAEWEYACRAGSTTKYCCSDNPQDLKDYAWFIDNSRASRFPVGRKKPNAWGLYDMHGNVWEWCSDWWGPVTEGAATDPKGPQQGTQRVSRGGSWSNGPEVCRSAFRGMSLPTRSFRNYGFRVAMSFEADPNPDPRDGR